MDTKIETRVNKFTDLHGRSWPIKMTVGRVKQIRDELDVDIVDAIDPTKTVIDDIANDPVLLCEILDLCCAEQSAKIQNGEPTLADSIAGDTVEEAANALIGAIVDFFPSGKTEVIRAALATKERMQKKVNRDVTKALTEMDDKAMDKAMMLYVKQSGTQSITPPESSE